MPENTILGLEFGDPKDVIKSLDDLMKFIEKAEKKVQNLKKQPSVTEAISGDKKQIESVQKGISDFQKGITEFISRAREMEDVQFVSKTQEREFNIRYNKIKNTVSDVSSEINRTRVDIERSTKDYKDYFSEAQKGLEDIRSSLSKTFDEMLRTSEAGGGFGSETALDKRMGDMEDQANLVSRLQSDLIDVNRGIDKSILSGAADTSGIEQFVNKTRNLKEQLKQARKNETAILDNFADASKSIGFESATQQAKQATQAVKALEEALKASKIEDEKRNLALLRQQEKLTHTITQQEDELRRLQALRLEANDPAIVRAVEYEYERVNAALEESKSLLTEYAQSTEMQSRSVDEIQVSQERLLSTIREQETELVRLDNQFRQAHDPTVLDAIKKKYENINTQLQANKEQLQAQRDLQRQSTLHDPGSGLQQASSLPGFRQAVNSLAQISGQAGVLASTVDSAFEVNELWNETIGETIGIMSESETAASDFFNIITTGAQDVSASVESYSNLSDQIMGLQGPLFDFGDKVQNMQTKVQGGAKAASKVGGAFKSASANIGKVLPALGAVMAAFETLKISLKITNRILGTSQEQIAKRREELKKERDELRKLNDLIQQGSIKAYEEQQEAIRQQIRDKKAEAEQLRITANETTGIGNKLLTIGDSFVRGNKAKVWGQTAEDIRTLNEETAELEEELESLSDKSIPAAIARVAELNEIAEEAEDVLEELNKRESELQDERMKILESASQLREDINELESDFVAESERLQEERNKEDMRMMTEHLDTLGDLESEYTDKVEGMRADHLKEMANKDLEFTKEQIKEREKFEESLAVLSKEYKEEEQEAREEYEKEKSENRLEYEESVAEMETDFAEERLERLEDLHDQLFEAELANDALRYFELKRQGEEEEKEAQKEHDEALTEEEKQFREEQAEADKRFKEEQKEREEQFKEKRQQMAEEFQEEQRIRHNQHVERMQELRQEHEDRLREERYFYEQSRSEQVESFREEQRLLEQERELEDAARIEQLATKREQLSESFELELEYFQKREEILQSYIDDLDNITDRQKTLEDAIKDGLLTEAEQNDLLQPIQETLFRLNEAGDALSEEDKELRDELSNLLAFMEISGDRDIQLDRESIISLSNVIERQTNRSLVRAQEENQRDLEYTQEEQDILDTIESATSGGGSVAAQASTGHTNFLRESGLTSLADSGLLITGDELSQMQELRRSNDEFAGMSLSQLRREVETTGEEAVSSFADMENRRRETSQREIGILEGLYSNILDVREVGEEDQSELMRDSYGERLGERRNFLEDTLQGEADYYGQESGLRDVFQNNQLDQSEAFYEGQRAAAGSYYSELNQQAENAMGSIETANQMTAGTVVSTWQSASTRIANIIQSSIDNIKSDKGGTRRRRRRYTSLSDKWSSFGDDLTSGDDTSGVGTTNSGSTLSGALMAAKGAFVDRPTSVIAGEGNSPEVIFPFDESEGIPDNILNKMGEGMGKYLFDSNYLPSKGSPMSMGGKTVNLSVGDVKIGNDMSRSEVMNMFDKMGATIVQSLDESRRGV